MNNDKYVISSGDVCELCDSLEELQRTILDYIQSGHDLEDIRVYQAKELKFELEIKLT